MSSDAGEGLDLADLFLDTSEMSSDAGQESKMTDVDFADLLEMSSDMGEESDFSPADFADLFVDLFEIISDAGEESNHFSHASEMRSDAGEESDFSDTEDYTRRMLVDIRRMMDYSGYQCEAIGEMEPRPFDPINQQSNSTDADFADLFVDESDLNSVAGGGPNLIDHFPHTSSSETISDAVEESEFSDRSPNLTDHFPHTSSSETISDAGEESEFSDTGEESNFTDADFANLFVHKSDLNSVAGEGPDLTDHFSHTSEMRSDAEEESDFSDTEDYTRRMLVDIRRMMDYSGYQREAIGEMEPRPFDPINPQSNFDSMSPEISHRSEDFDTDDEEDNLVGYLRSEIDGLDSMSPGISQQNDEDEEVVDNLVEYLRSEMNAAYLNNLFDEVERMADDFLQDLGGNSPIGGNPAAAQFTIENLPSILLTEDKMNTLCVVCQDKISSHQEVTQLPCLHQYHRHCICSWLEIRNSCPMCRYELPTDDPEYERSKRRRIN